MRELTKILMYPMRHAKPIITVRDVMENHEVWRNCPKCGAYNDIRKVSHCEECHTPLQKNEPSRQHRRL